MSRINIRPSDFAVSREVIHRAGSTNEMISAVASQRLDGIRQRSSTSERVVTAKRTVESTVARSSTKIRRMSEMLAALYSQAYNTNRALGKALELNPMTSDFFKKPPNIEINNEESLEAAFGYIYTANQNAREFGLQAIRRAKDAESELDRVAEELDDVDINAEYYESVTGVTYAVNDIQPDADSDEDNRLDEELFSPI